jgi:tRNA (adenine37-N6)-methyltransferase
MSQSFLLTPVAIVTGGRFEPIDDSWDSVESALEFDESFDPEALAGLEAFSHIEVIFVFDRVAPEAIHRGARHPRGRVDWPRVGIFAQRGKDRPNRLGVTMCRLLGVEGRRVRVRGLDAIDGTPVIDVKPVMREFLPRGEIAEPEWASELMKAYW